MNIIARLRFFYSGKGDTILVEVGAERGKTKWGLVDCCLTESSGSREKVRDFLQKNVSDFEFVCLTHPDTDHFMGMRDLLHELYRDTASSRLRVGSFWDSGLDYPLAVAIGHRLGPQPLPVHIANLYSYLRPFMRMDTLQRQFMQWGAVGIVEFRDFYLASISPRANKVDRFNQQVFEKIMRAPIDEIKRLREESNATSVVLVLMHKRLDINVLLGGDATSSVWEEALSTWERLTAALGRPEKRFHLIKVSHHGAETSLHPPLYRDYAIPDETIAVLTVSPGDPNHPHDEVLRALRENRIHAYATMSTTETVEIPSDLLFVGRAPEGTGYTATRGCDIMVEIDEDGRIHVTPEDCRLP